eukprot:s2663_g8.t1
MILQTFTLIELLEEVIPLSRLTPLGVFFLDVNADLAARRRFRSAFGAEADMSDLRKWHELEETEPDLFGRMHGIFLGCPTSIAARDPPAKRAKMTKHGENEKQSHVWKLQEGLKCLTIGAMATRNVPSRWHRPLRFDISLPSGRSETISLARCGLVADLKIAAQQSLGKGFLRLAAPDGRLLDPLKSLATVWASRFLKSAIRDEQTGQLDVDMVQTYAKLTLTGLNKQVSWTRTWLWLIRTFGGYGGHLPM